MLKAAPYLHILATSRESLQTPGEFVHRLTSLETPPPDLELSVADALAYPSIQLFNERASSSLEPFEIRETDVLTVVGIVRRLDGIPLAIELAASTVDQFGIQGLADCLDDRFHLLSSEHHAAVPRHQTLRATLDWSHEILSDGEKAILRRVSVFRGCFTTEDAVFVASDDLMSASAVSDGLVSLVAKSLVTADLSGDAAFYRLLDMTRAYAREKLSDSGEARRSVRLHALHCVTLLQEASRDWATSPLTEWRSTYCRRIDDIRAAIDWSFSSEGKPATGVVLTVWSIPLGLQLSLLSEYRRRSEVALAAVQAGAEADRMLEMQLNVALGSLVFQTEGPVAQAGAYFQRALEISQSLPQAALRSEAFGGMWIWTYGCGDYLRAVQFAREFAASLGTPAPKASALIAERMMALSLFFQGEFAAARRLGERALADRTRNVRLNYSSALQIDRTVTMRILLARIQWLQGFPEQAMRTAHDSIDSALSLRHAVSLCSTLAFGGCTIALWNGDLPEARRLNAMLTENSEAYSLGYWQSWARSYDLVIDRLGHGPASTGETISALSNFAAFGDKQLDTLGTVSPYMMTGTSVRRVESQAVGWCAPEVLRVEAEDLLRDDPMDRHDAAEALLEQSIAIAEEQGAVAWELRSSTSLALLRKRQGRQHEAFDLVKPVYSRYTEGFETADLLRAGALIDALQTQ